MRGWAIAVQEHSTEGLVQLRQGLDTYRSTGAEAQRPHFLTMLAEASGLLGQPEGGLAALEEALTLIEKTGERYYEAELHRQRGELLLLREAKSHPDQDSREQHEAETCFQHALDVARRQQAKSFELRAAMSLARLWQRQGKRVEAHALLEEIYRWFTEGFDTADLQEAKALLGAVGRGDITCVESLEQVRAMHEHDKVVHGSVFLLAERDVPCTASLDQTQEGHVYDARGRFCREDMDGDDLWLKAHLEDIVERYAHKVDCLSSTSRSSREGPPS